MNSALSTLVDALVAPIIRAAPLSALLAIAAVSGFALIHVIKRTSNQSALAATKREMHASMFEIRLFNDDLRAVLRAVGGLVWHNCRYLAHSLVPLAWVALPLWLLVAQLQAFYGYAGLSVGAPVLLTAHLRESSTQLASSTISLETPEGVRVETPAVRLPAAGEILWRLVPSAPGSFTVVVRADGVSLQKTLDTTAGVARRSPVRGSSVVDLLRYPSEPPLPSDGPIAALSLRYEEPGLDVFGLRMHWLVVYFAASMLATVVLARWLGVTL